MHVTARTLATHALSIFGDHSDVMACRSTGYAMLASNSVQEVGRHGAHRAHRHARIAHPLHAFLRRLPHLARDQQGLPISDETIRALLDEKLVRAHRERALSPDRPILRGTAQNPDVFFQAREACNPFYLACPTIVQNAMDNFAASPAAPTTCLITYGAPDAERVIVIMGSGAGAVEEAIDPLNAQGEKLGLLKVRLYRPFAPSLPRRAARTVKSIAVLDRTKEPGALGEPLYQDVVTAFSESPLSPTRVSLQNPRVIGGRYGLSSKEFTPAMVKGIFDELKKPSPRTTSPSASTTTSPTPASTTIPTFSTEDPRTVRALFYGLGSDGTVGANKNSIKIIGSETPTTRRATSSTTRRSPARDHLASALRPQAHPLHLPHHRSQLHRLPQLQLPRAHGHPRPGCSRRGLPAQLALRRRRSLGHLPRKTRRPSSPRSSSSMSSTATKWPAKPAWATASTPSCRPASSPSAACLPRDEAIIQIKKPSRRPTASAAMPWSRKLRGSRRTPSLTCIASSCPSTRSATFDILPMFPRKAPASSTTFSARWPQAAAICCPSARCLRRNLPHRHRAMGEAQHRAEIPVWDTDLCIQCGKCVWFARTPSSAPRSTTRRASRRSQTFKTAKPKWRGMEQERYTLQVAPEDCTGCASLRRSLPRQEQERAKTQGHQHGSAGSAARTEAKNWTSSRRCLGRSQPLSHNQVKDIQLLDPLFEFSGACAGCGETPYIKLLTQLFGDRLYIANATGCSSIYGGNLPTTPYSVNKSKAAVPPGPTRSSKTTPSSASACALALDQQKEYAEVLSRAFASTLGDELRRHPPPRRPKDRSGDRSAARARSCRSSEESSPASTRPKPATCSP
jgi:pyruvate-ferredoxin/flavodoxin oxidoreductase